jgi:hypothetical protein
VIKTPGATRRKRRGDVVEKICDATAGRRIAVNGEVCSSIATRHTGSLAHQVKIDDGTGVLTLLFPKGGAIPGLVVGRQLRVWGTAASDARGLYLVHPKYEFSG